MLMTWGGTPPHSVQVVTCATLESAASGLPYDVSLFLIIATYSDFNSLQP